MNGEIKYSTDHLISAYSFTREFSTHVVVKLKSLSDCYKQTFAPLLRLFPKLPDKFLFNILHFPSLFRLICFTSIERFDFRR